MCVNLSVQNNQKEWRLLMCSHLYRNVVWSVGQTGYARACNC